MQIKRSGQTGKERTQKLYEEASPEDNAHMRSFYYASRMWENTVYVIEDEQGVGGVLCLNPCRVRLGRKEPTLSYIVTVVARQKYRRRGIMRRILTEVLREKYAAGKPFMFLEPANPAYHTPFQFTYVSWRKKRILKNNAYYHCRAVGVGGESLLNELSACCNVILTEKYDIFCLRSPDYLRRVCGRVSVEEGRVLSVRKRRAGGGEKLIRMEVFDYPDTRERDARVVLLGAATLRYCGTEPSIVVRILSLPTFFAGISFREEVAAEERKFFSSLKDSLITEDNDVFLLHATKRGSLVERLSVETERRQHVTALTPEGLVTVFFSMQRASWAEESTSYRTYFDEEVWEASCWSGRGERQMEQTEYQEQLHGLVQWISESRRIVFFGGADILTGGGISDPRSAGGLYAEKRRYPPEQTVSHSFFLTHTKQFYDLYRERMLYPSAKPNAAHLTLAALERQGKLSAVITQNIDGLHEKTGDKRVLPPHGTVLKNRCSYRGEFYSLAELLSCPGTIPHYDCDGIIKPDVALYEEMLDSALPIEAACRIAGADLLIIGGTSLAVYPAAGLLRCFDGRYLVVINRSAVPTDQDTDSVIQASIGGALSKALEEAR